MKAEEEAYQVYSNEHFFGLSQSAAEALVSLSQAIWKFLQRNHFLDFAFISSFFAALIVSILSCKINYYDYFQQ